MTYTASTTHSLFCIHLAVLHCLLPTSCDWGFLKDKEVFFLLYAVRSVHPSNPRQVGLEVTVNVLSQMGREECLQLGGNMGWLMHEKILPLHPRTFSPGSRHASPATEPIWSFWYMPRRVQLPCLFRSPLGNTPLLVLSALHWMADPYMVKIQSLIFT